jgi:hypothetical protein
MSNAVAPNEQRGAGFLQPHPLTSVMQLTITAAAVCVAAAACTFAIRSMSEERNAKLVEIGVAILRVDPEKETQVSAARKWALDLIDTNAGVKFSEEARTELLRKPLDTGWFNTGYGYTPDTGWYNTGYGYTLGVTLPPVRPPPQSK